jgi:hypothetical protein
MATNFPTNKDNFTNPKATDPVVNPSHADQHADANDAIEALQDKVGIDSSTDNTTHDFKLNEVADGDNAVSKTASQTLTNKTLTTPVINEIETPTGETLSYNDATDTLVNRNSEETLTNKTLTSPKVNELLDSNGNETIETPATASAINNLEVKNASAGNEVELNAKGGDTDIDIRVKGKGSGKVKVGNNPISFPNTPGSVNQALISDGAGNLSFGDVVSTDNPLISAATYLFARQQETPDLTLRVEAGNVYFGNQVVQFAGGNSSSFTAPSSDPRIDILSLDSNGNLVRTEGTEDSSPTAPDVPAGNIPIAQIFNRVGQTQINDSDQSDSNGYIQKDLRPFLTNDFVFGGDGSDGDLIVSSGTTDIDLGGERFVIKNYNKLSITGTGKVTFSNSHSEGTVIIIKCVSAELTSSEAPMLDMRGTGANGGASVSTGGFSGSTELGGNSGTHSKSAIGWWKTFRGSGGGSIGTGGSGGIAPTIKSFAEFVENINPLFTGRYSEIALVGSGGGSGGARDAGTAGTTVSGKGGKGTGALIIQCLGSWNFTTVNGIHIGGEDGGDGSAGTDGNAGGGGAGGGGTFLALVDSIIANTGTVTIESNGGSGAVSGSIGNIGAGGGGSGKTAGQDGDGGQAPNGGDGGDGLDLGVIINTEFF